MTISDVERIAKSCGLAVPAWTVTRILVEVIEERAAIKEFCGCLPRAEAEKQAVCDILDLPF